jgi:tRNA modification GTPase
LYYPDDTIAAIASAPSGAARGIVRLSGPRAADILASCFRPNSPDEPLPTRASAVRGKIVIGGEQRRDLPVDLYYWPTARSYTREIAAELHTFGSPPLVAAVLATMCAAGARLAEPGEFTLRAFLAGRIDLTQAEAVMAVVDAHGQRQFQHALEQLAGGLARPLARLRESLLELLADVEAGLDFAEEDLEFVTRDQIAHALAAAAAVVAQTSTQLVERRRHDQLPRVVLVGWPNVGKSSLFNALAGSDALVSDTPGTTRDYLTATLTLDRSECRLIDTAGHDPSGKPGEIRRFAQQMTASETEACDVQLLCLDATRPPNSWEQAELAANPATERLVVWTKCDQPHIRLLPPGAIATSARTSAGLDQLRGQLAETLVALEPGESAGLTAQRCGESLRAASEALARAVELNATGAGEELLAAELRAALGELGKVAGTVYTDDILDRIFSRFCIGK